MDGNTNNDILSIVAIVLSVGSAILTAINHTRIRSGCFGKVIELCNLDIDRTSTPSAKPLTSALAPLNETSGVGKQDLP